MDIKVDIDKEKINKAVSDAIINSAIGFEIEELIGLRESLTNCTKVVEAQITAIIRDVLNEHYREQLKDAVKGHITDEVIAQVISASWDALMEKLNGE